MSTTHQALQLQFHKVTEIYRHNKAAHFAAQKLQPTSILWEPTEKEANEASQIMKVPINIENAVKALN